MTPSVRLSGRLICTTPDEAARVAAALPAHVEATRAEPGCLHFDVIPSTDPLVWTVAEEFVDPSAFEAHQTRSAASDWAQATAGITREYRIEGLE